MAVIRNLTTGTVLADRAEVARNLFTRIIGLLARRFLEAGEALVLPRCRAIHTCFMRFPIDVVFLRQGTIVKLAPEVKPFQFTWALRADTAIELPAQAISQAAIQLGQRCAMTEQ